MPDTSFVLRSGLITEIITLQLSPVSVEAAYICNSIAHGGKSHVLELTNAGNTTVIGSEAVSAYQISYNSLFLEC